MIANCILWIFEVYVMYVCVCVCMFCHYKPQNVYWIYSKGVKYVSVCVCVWNENSVCYFGFMENLCCTTEKSNWILFRILRMASAPIQFNCTRIWEIAISNEYMLWIYISMNTKYRTQHCVIFSLSDVCVCVCVIEWSIYRSRCKHTKRKQTMRRRRRQRHRLLSEFDKKEKHLLCVCVRGCEHVCVHEFISKGETNHFYFQYVSVVLIMAMCVTFHAHTYIA